MSKPFKSKRRDKEMRRGDERHQQSLHGSSETRVDDIIIVPTRQASPTISLSGFVLLVASFFVFKGGCIAWLGAEDYQASIKYLKSGSVFEQAAAFVMTPDVLSQFLASKFRVVLS